MAASHIENLAHLESFAQKNHIEGLTLATLQHLDDGSYPLDKAENFLAFQHRINQEMLSHKVITFNPYTHWFANANLSHSQVKSFIVQFSVFSNQFLVAQLHKMINADTIEEMRASKEILANEIGVHFSGNNQEKTDSNGDLGGVEGSVEGGRFHFRAAHFELLVRMAEQLDRKSVV